MPQVVKYHPHDERNAFLSRPEYKDLPDGVNWELAGKPMRYVDPWGKEINVPVGFKTDFASIPDLSRIALYVLWFGLMLALNYCPWFWILFLVASWVIYIAESFLHEGTWDDQSALHDWMYATRCRTFLQSNWILFVSMRAKGGVLTPTWKRVIIFLGVSAGGYKAWIDDARKLNNRSPAIRFNQITLK